MLYLYICIVWALASGKRILLGLQGSWLLQLWWKSCPSVSDLMTVFYTTGADGVHMSAGAEDGNSGQCQVERCPNCLHRWLEPNINLRPADVHNKILNYHSVANRVQDDLCHGWFKLRSEENWPLSVCQWLCLAGRPGSPLSDSEDENPEALQPLRPSRPLGHYSLCEQGQPDSLLLATPPPSPRDLDRDTVVINQPAPLSSPHQAGTDTLAHSSESVRHYLKHNYTWYWKLAMSSCW